MFKLTRLDDNHIITGIYSSAVLYDEDKIYKEVMGERPIKGCSMVIARGINSYWITTEITEILEDTQNYVRFKTKNSLYEWKIIK